MATAAQIKHIKDKIKDDHNGYIVRIDDKVIFDSRTGYIVWDWDNELVYVSRTNIDPYTQAESPMIIEVAPFSNILFIDYFF